MADTQSEVGSSSSDLGALLESADGADVTLVVGGSEVPAHSQILTVRSPVFAAMLRNDMKEAHSRRIEIKDMEEDVLRQMLSFVYTDTAPDLGIMAAQLLTVTDKYDLPLLKRRCEERLAQDLTEENAAATATLAVVHRCQGLRDAAVQFVAGHPEVMGSAGWAQLLRENVEAAVEVCERLAVVNKQLAVAQPSPPPDRTLPEEHSQILAKRLVIAASAGQNDELRDLLQLGAPVDAADGDGGSALYRAVMNNREVAIRCLIDAGADVNVRGPGGNTPLHRAALKSHVQHAIWMLLGASADTGVQDDNGQTPLHLAAKYECAYSTKALLLAGARRDIRDNNGKLPEHLAIGDIKQLFNTIN